MLDILPGIASDLDNSYSSLKNLNATCRKSFFPRKQVSFLCAYVTLWAFLSHTLCHIVITLSDLHSLKSNNIQ